VFGDHAVVVVVGYEAVVSGARVLLSRIRCISLKVTVMMLIWRRHSYTCCQEGFVDHRARCLVDGRLRARLRRRRLDTTSDQCGVGVGGLWGVSDILRGMSLDGL